MNTTINDSAIDDLYNYMYDYDDFEEGPHNEVEEMHALHVASLVIYSLAFLLGVPGNVMVIWFTGFKWKKTVSTIWFLNLAVADLIFVLFLPLHITYVATNFHWPFGKILCKLNSFIAILNMFASVFFLTVICLDKYISLVWPSIQRHRTVKMSGVVSGFVWSIATFIASPSLYFRDTEMRRSTIVCFNHFHETDYSIVHKIHTSLTLVKFFIGYLFPLLTMVTCYTILSIRMKRRATQTNSKFFWMVLAIVVAFFLCWTPYHIFSLLELHIHHSDAYMEWLRIGIPISTSLAFVNSCVNPILYVLISKAFRTHLEASLAEIFKNTIRDISQTGIKSDDTVLSENNFTLLETMT